VAEIKPTLAEEAGNIRVDLTGQLTGLMLAADQALATSFRLAVGETVGSAGVNRTRDQGLMNPLLYR
jgi:hypothetical protein